MLLDGTNFDWNGGGGPEGSWCRACKGPIAKEQRKTRVFFESDPHGFKGLTGDYHESCSRPFASMARALKVLGRRAA